MGRTYLFECPQCGYRAHVSGGVDRGENIIVQTILCADCRELYDTVIEFKPSRKKEKPPRVAPKFPLLMNRLPLRATREWLKFKTACPVSPLHRVRGWKLPGRCPKCGMFLEQSVIPFQIWD
jgi:transposase-like protein